MKNIYILPTDKPSRLFNCFGKLEIGDFCATREDLQVTNQHIYITSTEQIIDCNCYVINVIGDEEIKDEDWCLYFNKFGSKIVCKAKLTDTGFVYQELGEDYIGREDEGITPLKSEISKIILTTDPELIADGVQEIDDKFLQWFVHNPSCEFVEIEKGMFFESDNYHFYKIIIPERGFTITQQKSLQLTKNLDKLISEFDEPKQETLEEFIKEELQGYDEIDFQTYERFIELGANWQEQRMYSEEEVLKIAEEVRWRAIGDPVVFTKNFKKWLKQFKKK